MPRQPRAQLPDGFFHVTARGNRGQPIYLDRIDYSWFTAKLEKIAVSCDWQLLFHCLMPNHYHALLRVRCCDLSRGMELLNGQHAQRFNRRHGFAGHLFERRFRSWMIESNAHLFEAVRYVALNPVRAGLCGHPADWAWSSYRAAVGIDSWPSFLVADGLLDQFGMDQTRRCASFAAYVLEAMPALS